MSMDESKLRADVERLVAAVAERDMGQVTAIITDTGGWNLSVWCAEALATERAEHVRMQGVAAAARLEATTAQAELEQARAELETAGAERVQALTVELERERAGVLQALAVSEKNVRREERLAAEEIRLENAALEKENKRLLARLHGRDAVYPVGMDYARAAEIASAAEEKRAKK